MTATSSPPAQQHDSTAAQRRADALRRAAQAKRQAATARAETAIRKLVKNQQEISFRAVARTGGFSEQSKSSCRSGRCRRSRPMRRPQAGQVLTSKIINDEKRVALFNAV